ncbi:V-set and transmembrane domain-containing protein 5 [Brachionichthys hirsutus]|uniref:V-set and transmembrane domain-containing protein 5 n=1 Tax=Brachionichthys hirsutus TaxID=412623 RepID=UPI00360530BF
MWHLRLWEFQDVAVVLSVGFYLCHLAGALSIYCPQRSLSRSIQEDVLFSVNVSCSGVPAFHWMFVSAAVSRSIGAWQPGTDANVSEDYSSRVQTYGNGSLGLSNLRLQDAGYYVLTVTEEGGRSKDSGLVLTVNEVLYEDLQYLTVSALALAAIAGLLMLAMWLLDKAYRKISAWRSRREVEERATEMQHL